MVLAAGFFSGFSYPLNMDTQETGFEPQRALRTQRKLHKINPLSPRSPRSRRWIPRYYEFTINREKCQNAPTFGRRASL